MPRTRPIMGNLGRRQRSGPIFVADWCQFVLLQFVRTAAILLDQSPGTSPPRDDVDPEGCSLHGSSEKDRPLKHGLAAEMLLGSHGSAPDGECAGRRDADIQAEAKHLLSSWLRHEEDSADLLHRRTQSDSKLRPTRDSADSLSMPALLKSSSRRTSTDLYRKVEGKLKEVQGHADAALAADVDVALRCLANRRMEKAEEQARASAKALSRPSSKPLPPERDPFLRMEARHRALEERRRTVERRSGSGTGGAEQAREAKGPPKPPRMIRQRSKTRKSTSGGRQKPLEVARSCQDLESETASLDAEVAKAREEIEREVKAVRELHAAEQARARKASEVRSLEQQLEEVQQQKDAAKSARRERAGAEFGSLLDALWQRMMRAHSRWALHHLSDASKMLRRKSRIISSAHCVFVLSACARVWREVASSAIADRQAAQHVEVMRRAREGARLADAHYMRRLASRSWLAWRLEVHHVQTERSKEAVSARASAFLNALALSADTDPSQAQVAPDAAEHVEASEAAEAVISNQVEDGPPETSPTETNTETAEQATPVQACNSREARPASRSRELRAIERRVQERRKAQEERRQQRQKRQVEEAQQDCVDSDRYQQAIPDPARRQQEGTQAASAHPGAQQEGCGPSLPPVASSSHAKPKALREMEKRAEERRLIHEERKKRQKEKEEEQKQKQAEEEQEKHLAEEQAKQERLRLRKEQAQEQRRLRAQRLVAAAIRRDRERQAVELYRLHQYIRVWCAMRQAVSHTAFWDLLALNRWRTALLKTCFTNWHRYHLHAVAAKSAARLARAHLAVTWFARRFAFRTLVSWLKKLQLAKLRQYWAAVAASRRWCLCLWLRCWALCSAESALQKTATAVRQRVQLLLRRSFSWWQTGLKQLRVENAMESHKSALRDRISSWLQEMEDEGPNSLGSLHMPNFQLLNMQGEKGRGSRGASLRWAQWRRCQKKRLRHRQGPPLRKPDWPARPRLAMRRAGLLQRREVHQYKVSYVSGRSASFPARLHRRKGGQSDLMGPTPAHDQLSQVLKDAAQPVDILDPKVAALQAVAKAAQAAEELRGVQEYQKVNDWVAANPFYRPYFVSGVQPAVIESPPGVMGILARTNPLAAWHAAETVRMAAEDFLPGGDLYHLRDRGPALAEQFMSSASLPPEAALIFPALDRACRQRRQRVGLHGATMAHGYYKQRYTLFSRYDHGIQIDKDMWYSVTPEPIAKEQARKVAAAQRGQPGIVVDSFCGAGGKSAEVANLSLKPARF
ncbi:Trimethylguanosine synthase [Symbiodinium microadriaticum]|uniref:Trimethylguanosine synthase n=1 Tax=Symbiodinium microadriaticum TaxID=2951 RepID=A0A1Q9DQQ3_SYMMI|nr:Trimethylguanosine synthase [Symbiodinium microadriaticum]